VCLDDPALLQQWWVVTVALGLIEASLIDTEHDSWPQGSVEPARL
jgi:hypothetical protein